MKFRNLASIPVVALSFLFASCGGSGGHQKAQEAVKSPTTTQGCAPSAPAHNFAAGVIGGSQVDSASWLARSVFMLVQEMDEGVSICSATLVAPDIVLTAAHCAANVGPEKTFAVFEGDLGGGKPRRREAIKASLIRVNPNFSLTRHSIEPSDLTNTNPADPNRSGVGDLALIRLERAAPAPFVPVRLAPHGVAWSDVDGFTLAGFGWTSSKGSKADPALHEAKVPPLKRDFMNSVRSRLNSAEEQKSFDFRFNQGSDAETIWLDQSVGHGFCHGDSGGPAFFPMDGQVYQIGVASQVLGPQTSPECTVFGQATNINYYRAWIEQTLRELRGGATEDCPVFR